MALVGKNSEKNNQNLMQLIRRAVSYTHLWLVLWVGHSGGAACHSGGRSGDFLYP